LNRLRLLLHFSIMGAACLRRGVMSPAFRSSPSILVRWS